MRTLFIDYFISTHKPDTWVVYTMGTLFFLSLVIFFGRAARKKKSKPQLSNSLVDNVETIAFGIKVQINRCKDADDLNKAVGAIGKYEWRFEGNAMAEQEAKELKDLLDKKINEIYGVQTIVS